ncbi:unnamed protein product [Pleuronectes platessa]|uniref:Uncharacterized protein n=1 Tax=Pleuronectes platessa TaxID=8262 RepID=A0A9N7UGH4_PLEPL|nr:unnamed protein product [Pleuronectes platessa]
MRVGEEAAERRRRELIDVSEAITTSSQQKIGRRRLRAGSPDSIEPSPVTAPPDLRTARHGSGRDRTESLVKPEASCSNSTVNESKHVCGGELQSPEEPDQYRVRSSRHHRVLISTPPPGDSSVSPSSSVSSSSFPPVTTSKMAALSGASEAAARPRSRLLLLCGSCLTSDLLLSN